MSKDGIREPDQSGRRRPIPIPGSEFKIDVDLVIVAIGTAANPLIQSTTPDLKTNKWGYIIADPETGGTSKKGVYAGGDIVTGSATVILAMERAARRRRRFIITWRISNPSVTGGPEQVLLGPGGSGGTRRKHRPGGPETRRKHRFSERGGEALPRPLQEDPRALWFQADRPGPQARAPLGLCAGPPFIATGHP